MPSLPDPQLRVPATLMAVRDLAAALRNACDAGGVDEGTAFELELALVEAANNIVEHGFDGASGEIGMDFGIADGTVRIVLSDSGPPAPDGMFTAPTAPADPLSEEGRGLAIIASCVDEIDYRSVDGVNRLTLTRTLSGG